MCHRSRRTPEGLSTLYCAQRALLNNLHPRLETYGAFAAQRWLRHGDTSAADALIDAPPEVLLTTPESSSRC